MGMSREEFALIVAGIKSVYPGSISNQDAFNVWYELLKDMDYPVVNMAAQAYMMYEHFPPVPADIRRKAMELTGINSDLSEGEAWSMVRKAISNGIYGYADEFKRLPEDIQKAVGSDKQLQIWAMDENFNESVVQSQFLRSYRKEKERTDAIRVLPDSYQQLLTSTADAMGQPQIEGD